GEIIRGRIGFEGFLMSDDLGMHALKGDFADRAHDVVAAGCDAALHCSGDMAEMLAVASGLGTMSEASAERLSHAMATIAGTAPRGSYEEAAAKRDALLAYA
ncbi:MAG: beta-N-acetylhexosaminidase, partial [Alphaproteobacteria bacterium]|nr:beta-N-acetylhexosaminidase [Alphaproteobacteria bacterium]